MTSSLRSLFVMQESCLFYKTSVYLCSLTKVSPFFYHACKTERKKCMQQVQNNIYIGQEQPGVFMTDELTLASLNPAQMLVLESFASVTGEEELAALTKLLKNFYAERLEQELEKHWEDGSFGQEKLEQLKSEHLRTPYRG